MYSLISIRIRASSESNSSRAITFASSVFPTPVLPKKINVPIGFLGSFRPALFLWIARTTFFTASSCPITFPLSTLSICANLSSSFLPTFVTGTPLIIETTSATFSSVTICFRSLISLSHSCCARFSSIIRRSSSSLYFLASK